MYKLVKIHVVARGKKEEDKALWEKAKKILEKHGVSGAIKKYSVKGRKSGMVFLEGEEYESEAEAEAALAKVHEDKEWQDLMKEQSKLDLTVDGSEEIFILTDY